MVSQTQIGLSTVAASKFATLLLPPGRRPKPLALRLAISFLSSLLPWRHADAGPAEVGLTDYDIDYRSRQLTEATKSHNRASITARTPD